MNAVQLHRALLKTELRGSPCPVCGKPVMDGDLHEGILKRGDVNHALATMYFDDFYTSDNCFLLHHDCHMAEGQSPALREALIRAGGRDAIKFLEFWAEKGSIEARQLLNQYGGEQ